MEQRAMKRFSSILACLLAIAVSTEASPRPLSVPTYNSISKGFFSRLATQPTQARAALYDQFIKTLIQNGIMSTLDGAWMYAAQDAVTARTNIVSANYTATGVSSPTFTANVGLNGDGTSSFDDTHFNPTTATAPHCTLNSCAIYIFSPDY